MRLVSWGPCRDVRHAVSWPEFDSRRRRAQPATKDLCAPRPGRRTDHRPPPPPDRHGSRRHRVAARPPPPSGRGGKDHRPIRPAATTDSLTDCPCLLPGALQPADHLTSSAGRLHRTTQVPPRSEDQVRAVRVFYGCCFRPATSASMAVMSASWCAVERISIEMAFPMPVICATMVSIASKATSRSRGSRVCRQA